MESMKNFKVDIEGVGILILYAYTKWQAIDVAYTAHKDAQPDRKKYKHVN